MTAGVIGVSLLLVVRSLEKSGPSTWWDGLIHARDRFVESSTRHEAEAPGQWKLYQCGWEVLIKGVLIQQQVFTLKQGTTKRVHERR